MEKKKNRINLIWLKQQHNFLIFNWKKRKNYVKVNKKGNKCKLNKNRNKCNFKKDYKENKNRVFLTF